MTGAPPMRALRGGPHARRTGRGLSESEEGALRYRRLQERAPPGGRGRAARLRVRLGVEHHFTDYTMCPDVLQFLTYMAGRTQRAQLGSMVVVLPWHDPLRVAEEVSMLDNISDGRLILGLGRGAGRVEFDGFRLSMDESRERFG